jgi:cardiolipin synthase A/B
MFDRRALTSASATASLAVILVATAGCKVQVGSAAQASSGAGPAASAGVTRAGSLIVEPGAGFSPVYSLINGARHSIDMTMYEFSDTTAEHDLATAARRGVRVHVILDRREQSANSAAYSYLSSHAVMVTWSSPEYRYTHQKTMIVDGAEAVIMTANLTSQYYATSRDFLVVDTSRADVTAITAVFDADFTQTAVHPGDGSDLVWSPTDSEDQLLGLINGATSSLRIYSEEMGDTTVENALVRAAKRGVDVQVCGENQGGEYDRLNPPKGGGFQPRLAPRCRFAVHRPGSPVASPAQPWHALPRFRMCPLDHRGYIRLYHNAEGGSGVSRPEAGVSTPRS